MDIHLDPQVVERLRQYTMQQIQVALNQEADRLLEEAREVTPLFTSSADIEIETPGYGLYEDEERVVEGTLSTIIDDPTRLLGSSQEGP